MGWFSKSKGRGTSKRATSTSAPPESTAPLLSESYDQVVDVLGYLLRTYGKLAFDLESASAASTESRYKVWARHAITGGPYHDAEDEEQRGGTRQWRRMRHDFSDHRKAEYEHVERMRLLILEMLSGIREAFAQDSEADGELRQHIERLRVAAQSNSLSALREQVMATVGAIEETIEAREERHQTELKSLGQRLHGMKSQLAAARREAEIDSLTKLYNRASFDTHLDATAQLSDITAEPVSLLMVDIDHFKKLNDEHGHLAGDEALRVMSNCFVRIASRKTDFVARYGGEEFAIVLGDTDASGAARVAERVLEATRKLSIPIGERQLKATVSIGVATLTSGESTAHWLDRADRALYGAKESGRNCFRRDEAEVPT